MRPPLSAKAIMASAAASGTWRGHRNAQRGQTRTYLTDDVLGLRPKRLKRATAFNGEAQNLAIGSLNKVPTVGVVVACSRSRVESECLFDSVAGPARCCDRTIHLAPEILECLEVFQRDEFAIGITRAAALSVERLVSKVHRRI